MKRKASVPQRESPCVIKPVYSITFSHHPLEQPGTKGSPTRAFSSLSTVVAKRDVKVTSVSITRHLQERNPWSLSQASLCVSVHIFYVETPSKKCVEIISLYFCNPSADISSEEIVRSVLSDAAEKIKSGLIIRELPLCLCAFALLTMLCLGCGRTRGCG